MMGDEWQEMGVGVGRQGGRRAIDKKMYLVTPKRNRGKKRKGSGISEGKRGKKLTVRPEAMRGGKVGWKQRIKR